jgi:hypothetical protein
LLARNDKIDCFSTFYEAVKTINKEDFKMKRLALFVVALVFAFSTAVIAADKPTVSPAAETVKVEKAADVKADQDATAKDKKVTAKKTAADKKAIAKKKAAAKKAKAKKANQEMKADEVKAAPAPEVK